MYIRESDIWVLLSMRAPTPGSNMAWHACRACMHVRNFHAYMTCSNMSCSIDNNNNITRNRRLIVNAHDGMHGSAWAVPVKAVSSAIIGHFRPDWRM